jgi:hypothetical protein
MTEEEEEALLQEKLHDTHAFFASRLAASGKASGIFCQQMYSEKNKKVYTAVTTVIEVKDVQILCKP